MDGRRPRGRRRALVSLPALALPALVVLGLATTAGAGAGAASSSRRLVEIVVSPGGGAGR